MRLRAFPECVGPRILLLESVALEQVNTSMVEKKKLISKTLMMTLTFLGVQPRPQGFSLKNG